MTILQHVIDDVLAHARQESPRECCGILLGLGDAIVMNVRAGNLAEGTTRFLVDPADHVAARRLARSRHLDVAGFYHSHPRSHAWPSETDLADAAYPEALQMIAGVGDAGWDVRVFAIAHATITEIPFTTAPALAGSPRPHGTSSRPG